MKKKLSNYKVAILACSGFEESEMVLPRAALMEIGAIVYLISPNAEKITAWFHGNWSKQYTVDVKLEKANPQDYDALLLPGGVINPDKLRTYESAIKFIDYFFKKKKPIAAICHGPIVLVETGKLKGRKVTSYQSIKTDLKNAGARWQDKPVVIDGNLITSRKPSDIPMFNRALLKVFSNTVTK